MMINQKFKKGDLVRTLTGESGKVIRVGTLPGDGVPILVRTTNGIERHFSPNELERVPGVELLKKAVES